MDEARAPELIIQFLSGIEQKRPESANQSILLLLLLAHTKSTAYTQERLDKTQISGQAFIVAFVAIKAVVMGAHFICLQLSQKKRSAGKLKNFHISLKISLKKFISYLQQVRHGPSSPKTNICTRDWYHSAFIWVWS